MRAGSEGGDEVKTEAFICSLCISTKYSGCPGVNLTEVGSRHKDKCTECGKRAYGAMCRIETTKKKKP